MVLFSIVLPLLLRMGLQIVCCVWYITFLESFRQRLIEVWMVIVMHTTSMSPVRFASMSQLLPLVFPDGRFSSSHNNKWEGI